MGNWLCKERQEDDLLNPLVATWPHTPSYYYLGVVDQGCKHLWLHLSIAAKITLDGWESGCNSEDLQVAPLTQPAGGDLTKNYVWKVEQSQPTQSIIHAKMASLISSITEQREDSVQSPVNKTTIFTSTQYFCDGS